MSGERYDALARFLHWISALAVAGLIPAGIYLGHFDPPDGPTTDQIYNLHESLGATLWIVTLLRVVARIATGAPSLPPSVSPMMRFLAGTNQLAIYLVLLVQPVTGFLANNAGGYDLDWFGVVPIPTLIGKNDGLSDSLFALHQIGGAALVVLVCIHLAAAAYHGVIRRDGVVSRIV